MSKHVCACINECKSVCVCVCRWPSIQNVWQQIYFFNQFHKISICMCAGRREVEQIERRRKEQTPLSLSSMSPQGTFTICSYFHNIRGDQAILVQSRDDETHNFYFQYRGKIYTICYLWKISGASSSIKSALDPF